MVDVMGAEVAEANIEAQTAPAVEGDFSPRKIKIVAGMLIGQSFGTSILPYTAVFFLQLPLMHEFHWTAQQFGWAVTFLFTFGGLSLWPIGRIADKVGVRPVLLIGTIIVGLVTLLMAFQSGSLWQFYALNALLGIFGSTGVTYTKVVAALFTQNRGKAMAVLNAETSFARALVPLFINWLLLSYGWRNMYLVFGAMILTCVPVLFFTIEEPGERGLSFRRPPNASPPQRTKFEGMTIWEALRDRVFWLSGLAVFIGLFMFQGMFPNLLPALLLKGFDQTTIVWLQTISMLIAFVGALAGGWLADRVQTARIAVPFCLIAALGSYLTLIVTPSVGGIWLLGAAMILGGIAFTAMLPLGQYFATRFFGLNSLTEIIGVQFMFTNLFAGYGAPLYGHIYDKTHSYNLVFTLNIVLWLVTAAIWFVLPRYRYSKNIGQMPAAQ